jgi:hypothetical protein
MLVRVECVAIGRGTTGVPALADALFHAAPALLDQVADVPLGDALLDAAGCRGRSCRRWRRSHHALDHSGVGVGGGGRLTYSADNDVHLGVKSQACSRVDDSYEADLRGVAPVTQTLIAGSSPTTCHVTEAGSSKWSASPGRSSYRSPFASTFSEPRYW